MATAAAAAGDRLCEMPAGLLANGLPAAAATATGLLLRSGVGVVVMVFWGEVVPGVACCGLGWRPNVARLFF